MSISLREEAAVQTSNEILVTVAKSMNWTLTFSTASQANRMINASELLFRTEQVEQRALGLGFQADDFASDRAHFGGVFAFLQLDRNVRAFELQHTKSETLPENSAAASKPGQAGRSGARTRPASAKCRAAARCSAQQPVNQGTGS